MAQQQNGDSQMWLRKEARDLFIRVVNTIIMRGAENAIPKTDVICTEAKKVVDNAFTFFPEPEIEEEEKVNEFDAKLPVIEK